MSALIHFIGLVTLVTAGAGSPHILIPTFNGVSTDHVIRIPTASIASQSWASATEANGITEFPRGEQTISISGSGAFAASPDLEMPHLSCCCPEMKDGLSADYNDPDPERETKKSAYVRLEHGTMSHFLTGAAIHIDLEVQPVNGQITITGVRHGVTQTIVVNVASSGPQTQIAFDNSPPPPTSEIANHGDHWQSYYEMGLAANAGPACQALPSDGGACGFRSSGCLTSSTAVKRKKPTAAQMKRRKDAHASCRFCQFGGDINCSSSSWP